MNIRKTVFILSLLLTYNSIIAQSINDSIFNNVILIDKKDVVKHQEDYLIDVVIDTELKKLPIIFNNSRLSKEFIENRLFKKQSIIIITPDWEFFNQVTEEATKMGGCIEQATTNIYYQKKHLENGITTDSIRISGEQPKLVFSQSLKDSESNDTIVFYHTESFGSSCCPKDTSWDIKHKLDHYISTFEKENNTKIGAIYERVTGKEVEHMLYFTLSTLNKEQKLHFLKDIRYWRNIDQKLNTKTFKPQIFTPHEVKKEGLILVSK